MPSYHVSAAVSSHVPERPERRDVARRIDAIVQAQWLGVGVSNVLDRIVEGTVRGELDAVSLCSAQRHFLRATGITHAAFRTIERACYATNLLREGASIADVVHLAGYFDQPHLTRSLKYLIGQTPAEIGRGTRQLSFLYKTAPPPCPDNVSGG